MAVFNVHAIPDRFADSHEIVLPRDLDGAWQMAVSCLRYGVRESGSRLDEQRVVVTPVDVAEGVVKPSFVLRLNGVPLLDFDDVMREMVKQLQLTAWSFSRSVYKDVYEILVRRFVLSRGSVVVVPGRRKSRNYYRFAFSEAVRDFLGFAAEPVAVYMYPVASDFQAPRALDTPSIRDFTVSSPNIQRDLTMASGQLLSVSVSSGRWGAAFTVSFDGDRLDFKPISDRKFRRVRLDFSPGVRVFYVCLVLKPVV